MFLGTFEQRIDEKGRLIIPAKFRELLGKPDDARLFVTNFRVGDARCLEARPYKAWLEVAEHIAKRTDLSPEAMEFFDNFYLPGAHECPIDGQGRLLVPPSLREYAGLTRDVVFTGGRGKFRIWDREKWQPVHLAGEQAGIAHPTVMTELGL